MKTRRVMLLAVMFGMAVSVSAQNVDAPKYGNDSVASVTNLSTYREYFKQWEAAKYSKDAISMEMVSAWRYVFMNSPRASQYVYTNGEKIMDYFIRTNPSQKDAYIDTLNLLADTRAICFPNDPGTGAPQVANIKARKGHLIYTYNPARYEEAYNELKSAVEMDMTQIQVGFLDSYFRAAADMVNNGKADKMTVIDVYQELSDVIDYNIKEMAPLAAEELADPIGVSTDELIAVWGEPDQKSDEYQKENMTFADWNYGDIVVTVHEGMVQSTTDPKKQIDKKYGKNTKSIRNYKGVKSNIDNLFQPFASCEDLIKVFTAKLNENPDDINLLKRITTVLDAKECTDSKVFLDASKKLYALEPSPEAAYNIGVQLFKDKKYGEAATYFEEATKSENNDRVFRALRNLAMCYENTGNFSKGRDAARRAAQVDPTAGEPYLIIAMLYAGSSKQYESSIFGGKEVFWAAVDKCERARQLDPSVAKKAADLIAAYRQYFPSTETVFFNDYQDGQSYSIGGWIGETTTIRTKK